MMMTEQKRQKEKQADRAEKTTKGKKQTMEVRKIHVKKKTREAEWQSEVDWDSKT